MQYILGDEFVLNHLPVTVLATDRVVFPGSGSGIVSGTQASVSDWERWNDYGIGLLRKGSKGSSKGELRQAEYAFSQVEELGRPEGPLNLSRVYLKEGRLDEAADALHRAAESGAYPWSVAWFSGLVDKQNGWLDEALAKFHVLSETQFTEARQRGFDFSKDYRLLNEIGSTLFEQAKLERGAQHRTNREGLLRESEGWFRKTLAIDPENMTAHYNLALIHAQLGDNARADVHRELYKKYRPDDNARDRAVAVHRRNNPAANHAAESIVVYDLQRFETTLIDATRVALEKTGRTPPEH